MKVTSIQTFPVRSGGHSAGMIGEKIWLFVKVETDEGIHGWGEAYTQLDRHSSIEQLIKENQINLEIKVLRKDNSMVDILISSHPFYDDNGNFIGALGIMTDITKKKRIEDKLRENESKLKNIVEQMAFREGLTSSEWLRGLVIRELKENNALPKVLEIPRLQEPKTFVKGEI